MRRVGAARTERRARVVGTVALLAAGLVACGSPGPAGAAAAATGSPATLVGASRGIASVTTRVITTADGQVAYREIGKGTPLLLIMGVAGSIDAWEPAFVDALATHYRVIVFNNAGVGETSPLPSPLTVTAMADQTSAFISALALHRVDVFGWSMGGMIAQALAVLHPGQVHRLVLAATQPGSGHAIPIPDAAAADAVSADPPQVLSVLFPRDQAAAEQRYVQGILTYPGFYEAPRNLVPLQSAAIGTWMAGGDPVGHQVGAIRVPTLVADGTLDALDPVANDRMLAASIRGAGLALYGGAGHAFLFQDATPFVGRLERFLG
jgi:pimeloyl-ACP methyl ester carboxylesterase